MAELYTGYPLFPGENEVEQLACIMEVIFYEVKSHDDVYQLLVRRKDAFINQIRVPLNKPERCFMNSDH